MIDLDALIPAVESLPHVRDVVVSSTVEGVSTRGRFSVCSAAETRDVEKTVRRMLGASATIGSGLDRVILHFGGFQLVVVPLSAELNLLVLAMDGISLDAVFEVVAEHRPA